MSVPMHYFILFVADGRAGTEIVRDMGREERG
jgi:hypothetical protein